MRQSYLRRRDLICSLIDQTPGLSIKKPKGAFYAFVNAKELTEFTGMNSRDLCMDLLKKTGVVTVPGSGFGDSGEGFIRIPTPPLTKILRGALSASRAISGPGILMIK